MPREIRRTFEENAVVLMIFIWPSVAKKEVVTGHARWRDPWVKKRWNAADVSP